MKICRKLAVVFVFLLVLQLSFPASAHELWIEVEDKGEELQVEVLWGHIGDYLDEANIDDYRLFVRYPSGSVDELALERIGVQGRTFFSPVEEGEYVFWAEREPGTYTPGEGVTTLSVQTAKHLFHFGDGPGTGDQPVEMVLEIVPVTDLSEFAHGTLEGKVLWEGEPAAGAAVSAYGPGDRVLEAESDADGFFTLELDVPGTWLVKGNITAEEEGELDGEEYGMASRTTTLLIDADAKEGGTAAPAAGTFSAVMVIPLLIGLLLGGAGTLFMLRKK